MILLLRVDHRLLHGQVVFSWVQNLKADCILIANDSVATDELRKSTLKLAKPQEIKLVIKNINDAIDSINSGITDKYKLLIIVESIEDAYKITKETKQIKQINLGGIKPRENSKNISKTINLLENEELMLKDLIKNGIEIEIRQLATDNIKTNCYRFIHRISYGRYKSRSYNGSYFGTCFYWFIFNWRFYST